MDQRTLRVLQCDHQRFEVARAHPDLPAGIELLFDSIQAQQCALIAQGLLHLLHVLPQPCLVGHSRFQRRQTAINRRNLPRFIVQCFPEAHSKKLLHPHPDEQQEQTYPEPAATDHPTLVGRTNLCGLRFGRGSLMIRHRYVAHGISVHFRKAEFDYTIANGPASLHHRRRSPQHARNRARALLRQYADAAPLNTMNAALPPAWALPQP